MKLNTPPIQKRALIAAAFCAVMLAFSPNASAVVLDFDDAHTLSGVLSPAGTTDAQRTALVNHMIGMALIHGETFLGSIVFRSGNNFGPLPEPAVIGPSGTDPNNINIGSGLYSYLWAQYDVGGIGEAEVWYIGNLSGDITIPATVGLFGLTGWTLFGPGGAVPDGGTTVMLLGAALGALGMARRFLKA
jgi:hypothetical protein